MAQSLPNRWLYIDFNSFFASVEQQLNPALRGKPIAVVPVQTDSTCAIAASYEAKAFGIKTGTPIYEAKQKCKQLICVLAQHEAYTDFHHRILKEIDKHIPVSQVCSIDEMACQLMSNESSVEQATAIAHRIKQGLASHVGPFVKCSIGVAPNRYLAKVATDMQKPDGLTFLSGEDLPHKIYSLKLLDLPGIGHNMELRIRRFGIIDVRTLCGLDLLQIRKVWGSVLGERMWHHLRGVDLSELKTERRSMGHSHVMAPELRGPDKARLVARRLTLKVASRLRRMGYVASNISLSLDVENGFSYQMAASCFEANDSLTFLHLVDEMWKQILEGMGPVRIKKVGVTLRQLTEGSSVQPELFEQLPGSQGREKAERISRTLDTIHQRYGSNSLSLGLLPTEGRSFSGVKIAFTNIPEVGEFEE